MSMKIMINLEGTDSCREFTINQQNMKVSELKKYLSNYFKIPSNEIELLLNDYPLIDNQILSQIGIGDNLLTLRKKDLTNLSNTQFLSTPQNIILDNSNIYGSQNRPIAQSNIYTPNITNSISNIPIINNLPDSIGYTPTTTTPNPNLVNSIYGQQNQILDNPQTNNALGLSQSALLDDVIAYNTLYGINQSSPESQRRIEQIMNRQRIDDNLIQAAEYMPESLVPVHMLYINVEINNYKTAALIDTGAQSTFMSLDLCMKCGLMNLVDKRFQGIARGVGSSRIVGVIHAAQIKIMNKAIATKINVIENNEVGFVFGLDSLRTHRCNVDLKQNGLVFPDIGITAKFLSDGEINRMKQQRQIDEENDEIERAKKESLNYI